MPASRADMTIEFEASNCVLPACVKGLIRSRIVAAIEQPVLSGDVAGMNRAEEGTGSTELRRLAEAACRILRRQFRRGFIAGLLLYLRCVADEAFQPVCGKGAGQQIVDGNVPAHRLAREACDETGQARTRAVRKPKHFDRRFDG